jgi:hypothetical protein
MKNILTLMLICFASSVICMKQDDKKVSFYESDLRTAINTGDATEALQAMMELAASKPDTDFSVFQKLAIAKGARLADEHIEYDAWKQAVNDNAAITNMLKHDQGSIASGALSKLFFNTLDEESNGDTFSIMNMCCNAIKQGVNPRIINGSAHNNLLEIARMQKALHDKILETSREIEGQIKADWLPSQLKNDALKGLADIEKAAQKKSKRSTELANLFTDLTTHVNESNSFVPTHNSKPKPFCRKLSQLQPPEYDSHIKMGKVLAQLKERQATY